MELPSVLDIKDYSELNHFDKNQLKELINECEFIIDDQYDQLSPEAYSSVEGLLEYLQYKVGGEATLKAIKKKAVEDVCQWMYIHPKDLTPEDDKRAVESGLIAIRLGCGWVVDAYEATTNIPGYEIEWAAISSMPNVICEDSKAFSQLKLNLGRELTEEEVVRVVNLSKNLVNSYMANDGKMREW
ncbi:hypothetical protein ACJJIF_08485 [Microbulbifer sp. SSSA002]|uniref:hypothetical protein n=1 Tax=Microbulbifer sp. SSSA002 TaxID=3243376 RepID=UPI0040393617